MIEVVPRTLNAEECQVPVKQVSAGTAPDAVLDGAALRDPRSLLALRDVAAQALRHA